MKNRKQVVRKSTFLQQQISQEEIARDWTLSDNDKHEISQYRKGYRLFLATQLCAVRLYGRFLLNPNELPAQVINYLSRQLDLDPVLSVNIPERKATLTEHRQNILSYLGFKKYDKQAEKKLITWIEDQARNALCRDVCKIDL